VKIGGRVLIGLGVFLVVLAVLALTYAPGALKKTPIDVDTVTQLEGQGARLGQPGEQVTAYSWSRVDSDASSDDVAVFRTDTCVVLGTEPIEPPCPDPRDDDDVFTVGAPDYFATDRSTAESVDDDALPSDAVPHEGVVNKWPFDAEQRTYPYWDGVLGRAVEAEFDRTEDLDGTEAYVYRVTIDDEPAVIAPASGDSDEIRGTYSDVKEIFVDPGTGAILDQTDNQQRRLENGDLAVDLNLAFTDDQVAANVEDAQADNRSLNLVLVVVPIIGFVGGALLLIAGLLLLRRAGRRGTPAPRARHEKDPVGV